MEKNVLLTIEYDGTGFSGWQRQPSTRTVQGELEIALSKACNTEIAVNGTSRTDAGVHALGQRASFIGDYGLPVDRIKMTVNNILSGNMDVRSKSGDIRITEVKQVPMDFHARFDCKGKTYRYIIENSDETSVFSRNYVYHVKKPLNVNSMKTAARYIVGTHDFASFQASGGTPRETTVRTINSLTVDSLGNRIVLEVTGDGFLYNMVRIIAGTLVDVGQGKIPSEDVEKIILSKNRQNAGHTAPACGLYLAEIYYDEIIEREAQ